MFVLDRGELEVVRSVYRLTDAGTTWSDIWSLAYFAEIIIIIVLVLLLYGFTVNI